MQEPVAIDAAQQAQEAALREIGEAMLAIEAAVARVVKAMVAVEEFRPEDGALRVSLEKAERDLERVRRHLNHDAYLDAARGRLF